MPSPLNDPRLEALLDRLYAQSDAQIPETEAYYARRNREGDVDWRVFDDHTHHFFADKLLALDRDKAEFCYQLCRSLRAARIVEAGTSFVPTPIYLLLEQTFH
jgi:hypothetical protein